MSGTTLNTIIYSSLEMKPSTCEQRNMDEGIGTSPGSSLCQSANCKLDLEWLPTINTKRMSRLQLTVKETFGMIELQNNTVIVPPTYFTLNKKGWNGLQPIKLCCMSNFVARGCGVSQGNKTQMQICEKQWITRFERNRYFVLGDCRNSFFVFVSDRSRSGIAENICQIRFS